ncbi:BA14K family protein [Hansschlegelia beijingensis]
MASSARPGYRAGPGYRTKRWCANRYRTYDWRTETFIGKGGRRYRCP